MALRSALPPESPRTCIGPWAKLTRLACRCGTRTAKLRHEQRVRVYVYVYACYICTCRCICIMQMHASMNILCICMSYIHDMYCDTLLSLKETSSCPSGRISIARTEPSKEPQWAFHRDPVRSNRLACNERLSLSEIYMTTSPEWGCGVRWS